MSKIIKTLQSKNKHKFDILVNKHLKIGFEIVNGTYSILDEGIYSQVVSLEDNRDDCIVENGKCTYYYKNGQIKEEGYNKDGKNDGKWTDYYEDGVIESERNFKDGKRDGKWTDYYENGQIEIEGNFKDGKEDGVWIYYDDEGIVYEGNFKNGELIK